MTKFYIRVDANDNIGIGHMMRCLSIAKAMRRRGVELTFFVADKKSAAMVAEAGFGYVCLNSDYDGKWPMSRTLTTSISSFTLATF